MSLKWLKIGQLHYFNFSQRFWKRFLKEKFEVITLKKFARKLGKILLNVNSDNLLTDFSLQQDKRFRLQNLYLRNKIKLRNKLGKVCVFFKFQLDKLGR